MGRATALRLARGGRPVYATARRLESIADLEAAGCRLLELDVTDDASAEAAVRAVEQAEGAVGVLVNNAGYSQSGAVEGVSLEQARRQLETNVLGAARMWSLVLPKMREQRGGRIVNVSSMGGRLVFPGGGWYHASKHALEALSDALRFEVAGFGIDVVVVEPGLIRTEFGTAAVSSIEPGEGPYAAFDAAVARQTANAYNGAISRFAAPPDAVARTIERALAAEHPKARYPVTAGARVLLGLRRVLPDRAWDALVARAYPRPG